MEEAALTRLSLQLPLVLFNLSTQWQSRGQAERVNAHNYETESSMWIHVPHWQVPAYLEREVKNKIKPPK